MSTGERLLLGAGCGVSLLLGSVFAAWHAPLANQEWKQAGLEAERGSGQWRAIHFLAAECRCSAAVERHLRRRGSRAGWKESVLERGSDGVWRERFAAADGTNEASEAARPEDWAGVEVAPWLVIVSPGGEVVYAGGYDAEPVYETRILAAVEAGRAVERRPVRGCATRQGARREIEIWKWKSWLQSI
jgi:hypothetical protein